MARVAVDVFNFDGSVIHQNADGESETASVMMLMVWPRALRQRTLTRIDNGIEMAMIRVLFQFPRNSKIIIAVRHAAMIASRMTPWMEART